MTSNSINSEILLTRNVNLQAGSLSIGRAGDNDLHISDQTVSSHHARIFTYLESSYIEDLDSTNGTYLNGKRVQKHTLQVGDIVKVGKLELEITKNEWTANNLISSKQKPGNDLLYSPHPWASPLRGQPHYVLLFRFVPDKTVTWGDPTLSSAMSCFTSEFGMRRLWPNLSCRQVI